MGSIKHATQATGTDAGTGDIHKSEWNAGHVGTPWPLDRYAIDGTYGDDFTGSSLSGSWTRRNYTSGAETYQQGIEASFIRIGSNSRANGDGYFRTAPGGDWTFAMKYIFRGSVSSMGLAVVDTNGTGVGVFADYSVGSPLAPLLLQVTTYTTYGGSYVEPGVSGSSPNTSIWTVHQIDRMFWIYLRKSSTSYYGAYSMDGELWSNESSALTWSGTVDRVAMMNLPLGGNFNAYSYVDIDWFNKIA